MKVTHRIYAKFCKTHKDEYIANNLIWCQISGKFIPDNTLETNPIEQSDLLAEYTKAQAEREASPIKDQLSMEVKTTLFLPVPEELEELLDNTTATICACPE